MELLANYLNLKLVPINEIPSKELIKDVSLEENSIAKTLVNLYNLSLQMEKICTAEDGVGLSAVQLGLPYNIFIVKGDPNSKLVKANKYDFFVNGKLNFVYPDKQSSLEGCLSIRSEDGRLRHYQVERYKKVLFSGLRLISDDVLKLEEIKEFELSGFEAIVFQHEMDHSLGILISDNGEEVFLYH